MRTPSRARPWAETDRETGRKFANALCGPKSKGRSYESRADECFRHGEGSSRLRPHQDFAGQPGPDPALEPWRDQKAGNDQLPYLQAGARWSVLRPDLRPGEGL